MAQTTKIPATLILPLPPKSGDPEDLDRYIRELHKVLDEWHKTTRDDVNYTIGEAHNHLNKDILDAITEAFTTALKVAYDDAVSKKHTHNNQSILDAITEAFTTTLKNSYDEAVSKSHIHSNKSILDTITETKILHFVNDYSNLPSSANVDEVYYIRNAKDLARWNGTNWEYLFKGRTWEEML